MLRLAVALLLAGSVPACGGARWAGRWAGIVRARHAAQYGCTERDVDVREIATAHFVAEGCDWRAIYICDRRTCEIDGSPTSMWVEADEWSTGTTSTGR